MNLNALFDIAVLRFPDKTALEFQDAAGTRSWTYRELDEAADGLAGHLRTLGVVKGDRVVIFADNSDGFVLSFLALMRLGAIMVPVNLRYRQRELDHILEDCQPRLIITDAVHAPTLLTASPQLLAGIETLTLDAAWPRGPFSARARVESDDTAFLIYTSGTTGQSKGAIITHNNVVATVSGLLCAWAWQPEDVLLLTLPLFHVHGLVVGLICALVQGATALLHRRFQVDAALAQLAQGRATLFFAVPTIYFRLIQALRQGIDPELAAGLQRMRLFCSGSAPLAAEDHRLFQQLTGHAILERYGMTETGMNFSNPYAGARMPGTVGLPLPGVSARLVDAEGHEVEPGREGELHVRGSNVFSAYWQAPEQTAQSFVHDDLGQRWFRTGDLGRMDPDTGYVTLLGRSHELILSGGFNVYPREIEETLLLYAGVREAAVIGTRHPEWGQVPLAYLVVDEGWDASGLEEFCRQRLASFKLPRQFRTVPELPRNAMGKLQKFRLPTE